MRRILMLMLSLVLSIMLTGCMALLQPKTVIISDADESSEQQELNGAFEVDKIYKLLENEQRNTEIFGWIDQEHVLGVMGGRREGSSVQSLAYRTDARQFLVNTSGYMQGIGVSPDGKYASYSTIGDGQEQIILFDLKNKQERVVQEWPNDQGYSKASLLTWSNNSRYVSYMHEEGSEIFVYDVERQSLNEYIFPGKKEKEISIYSVEISENGKNALIVKVTDRLPYIVFGSFNGNELVSEYEYPVSADGSFEFVNNDQIVFIGQDRSLTLFDRRNKLEVTLLQGVSLFQLSQDRKYIAYVKDQDIKNIAYVKDQDRKYTAYVNDRETTYVARLQGHNVLNEKVIYKGIIPNEIYWSQKNNKILLNGFMPYGQDQAGSLRIVVQAHLILEFK